MDEEVFAEYIEMVESSNDDLQGGTIKLSP